MMDREPRPRRVASRRAIRLAVVVVAVAVGVATALGVWRTGQPTLTASPVPSATASGAFADLPFVTVAPTATPGAATGSAPASVGATPASEQGIVANRIRIARLGIDLAIIEGDGIDAPIGKAAHYPGSAWPGDGSNIYIYGHAREGMFIALWQARTGDTIELDLANGTSRTYVVSEVLPKVPWDALKYLEPTKTEQLTLQTSTSYYPTAPRFIVIAVPAA